MIFTKKIEESIYLPIIQQFSEEKVDYELIGKIIVEACRGLEQVNADNGIDPKTIVKNALLLILGLIHKNQPLEEYGSDMDELDQERIEKLRAGLKIAFNGS
ncbi:MAG: hypothetical protein ACTSUE_07040 [Promethearchaeota archaeon]